MVRSVMAGERGRWGDVVAGVRMPRGSVPVVEGAVLHVLVFGVQVLVFIVSHWKQAQPRHGRYGAAGRVKASQGSSRGFVKCPQGSGTR